MEIAATIIPIFAIVVLGWFARRRGFIPPEFLAPANRLVYYIAIPAMIFESITSGSLSGRFDPTTMIVVAACVLVVYLAAWATAGLWSLPARHTGTFIQCAGHGNLGYVALAVAFYYLGQEGLVRAGLLAGGVMITQNLLSVLALQAYAGPDKPRPSPANFLVQVLGNPVIVSALAGIAFALLDLPVPLIVRRSLKILSGFALPCALLLIGATLSFQLVRSRWRPVLGAQIFKLVLLPGLGLILFRLFGLAPEEYLAGLILLAAPTATVSYVMGREMGGDPALAVAAISTSTLFSSLTYALWLTLAGV